MRDIGAAGAQSREHDQWIVVTGGDEEAQQRLRFWAMLAARSLDVEIDPFAVRIDENGELPEGAEITVYAKEILISPEMAKEVIQSIPGVLKVEEEKPGGAKAGLLLALAIHAEPRSRA